MIDAARRFASPQGQFAIAVVAVLAGLTGVGRFTAEFLEDGVAESLGNWREVSLACGVFLELGAGAALLVLLSRGTDRARTATVILVALGSMLSLLPYLEVLVPALLLHGDFARFADYSTRWVVHAAVLALAVAYFARHLPNAIETGNRTGAPGAPSDPSATATLSDSQSESGVAG